MTAVIDSYTYELSGGPQFARIVDGSSTDLGYSVSRDSSDNFYLVGSYYNTTPTVRDQSGTTLATLPASGTGVYAAFMCKFDSSGTYQYSRTVSSTLNGSVHWGSSVICDSSDNVYFIGSYYGGSAVTIKDQSGTSLGTLPASSGGTIFMCKFDSSGTYQYSRIVDYAATYVDSLPSVTCDSLNNVYLVGSYTATPTIKTQSGSSLGTLPASGTGGSSASTAFVCKFDSSGTYQYSRIVDVLSSNANEYGKYVACDSLNNMYIVGNCGGTANIYTQSGISLGKLPTVSTLAAFMCKFDSSGNFQYSAIVDTSAASGEILNGVKCDSTNAVYLTGRYQGTSNIKNQSGTVIGTLPNTGGTTWPASFISKLDSSGNYLYSRIISPSNGSTAYNYGSTAFVDSSDNVYLAGTYTLTPTIRDQSGTSIGTLPTSSGTSTAYLCKFDSAGTYQYSRTVDSTGVDEGRGVVCDSLDNVYLAGTCTTNSTIKNQSNTTLGTLPAMTSSGAFLVKFDQDGNYAP